MNKRCASNPDLEKHLRHMRWIALILAGCCVVLFFLNRSWLRDSTLLNSPSFDALVYQNQSYDDYWLIRSEGLGAIWAKYTGGQWHVPPLYMLMGTACYLLFGMDPANFYIMPIVWTYFLLLSVYGYIYHWSGKKRWAALGCLMVFSIPSVVVFGMRVSQTDYAVGCVFTLSTYLLVLSEGLKNRRTSIAYALSASVCALIKSSIVLYFAAHIAIIALFWICENDPWQARLLNLASCFIIGLVCAGWFFFFNLSQIIRYYTVWGTTRGDVSKAYYGIETRFDVLTFYLKSFAAFHLQGQHLFLHAYLLSMAIGLFVYLIGKKNERLFHSNTGFGLLVSALWLAIPYGILTVYGSKAYSVDFPFTAAFYCIPILIAAAETSRKTEWLLFSAIAIPFFFLQTTTQINRLFIAPPMQHWREEEILHDIFHDADAYSKEHVVAGTSFIHYYLTSENLRFYCINGSNPDLRRRFERLQLDYYDSAARYYSALLQADYILTKSSNLIPEKHANNILSPDVNQMIAASKMFTKIKNYTMPDNSVVSLYRNDPRFRVAIDAPMADQWIAPRHQIKITPERAVYRFRLSGSIPIQAQKHFPVELFVEDEIGNQLATIGVIENNQAFSFEFELDFRDAAALNNEPEMLYIETSKPFRPIDYGLNVDDRTLMVQVGELKLLSVQ